MSKPRLNPLAIQRRYKQTFSHYDIVNKPAKQLLAQAATKPEALHIKRTINNMYGYQTRRETDRARARMNISDILNAPAPQPISDFNKNMATLFNEIPTERPPGIRELPMTSPMTAQSAVFNKPYNDNEPYDWGMQTNNPVVLDSDEF